MIAFSCAPNSGSERKVAWNWLKALAARSHELTVLTPTSNRERIAPSVAESHLLQQISFLYIGNPRHEDFATKQRWLLQLYYVYWQWCARREALRISREKPFDVVHAITFGGVRFPAFIGGIARHAVLGPIGGGENAPTGLTDSMGLRFALLERLRHFANWMNQYDPFMRATFNAADTVLVKTAESTLAVPSRYRPKCAVRSEIGVSLHEIAPVPIVREESNERPFRILYAGRYLQWKGMDLGLRAFAKLLESCTNASLSLTGAGPAEPVWRVLAHTLGVADRVTWLGWSKYDDMPRIYRDHHALLFPSLHEASGNVIIEAFAAGLPVVCFKLGGPGLLVDEYVGRAVDVSAVNYEQAVDRLSAALRSVSELDANAYTRLSSNALERARGTAWEKVVDRVYEPMGAAALTSASRSLAP